MRSKILPARAIGLLMGALASAFLTGCPYLSNTKNAVTARSLSAISVRGVGTGSDPLAVFQSRVQPLARPGKGNCVACHDTMAPAIGSANTDLAYEHFLRMLDLTSGTAVTLVTRANDAHGTPQKVALGSEWQQAIDAYVDAVRSAGSGEQGSDGTGDTVVDNHKKIPAREIANLPTYNPANPTASSVELTFNLASIDSSFANSDLLVRVAKDNFVADTYRVFGVRLRNGSATQSVRIADLRVYISGVYDPTKNTFGKVDVTVPPGSTVLLSNFSSLPSKRAEPDTLAIGVRGLLYAAGCKDQASWVSNVKPIMTARCTTCHANTNNGGYGAFPMLASTPDAALCGAWLSRVNTAAVSQSLVLMKADQGVGGHQRVLSADDVVRLSSWIASEGN